MNPRWCFFVNPHARNGRARAHLDAVLRRAPAHIRNGAETVDIGSGDIRAVISALPPDTVPVAVGGDGTVNLIARSLREAGAASRPFCVLPLGAGNAFAHSLGVGTVRRALDALERGRVRCIDVMVTTHSLAPIALVSMSTGFESRLLAGVWVERTWRRWSRFVPGLMRHGRRRWSDVNLSVDGEVMVSRGETVYNAGLYNLPCYAFGRVMWPDGEADDGAAEAVVFSTAASYWKALARGVKMRQHDRGENPRWRRWQTARFESASPFQIDGEVVPAGAVSVCVERRAASVFVPPDPS